MKLTTASALIALAAICVVAAIVALPAGGGSDGAAEAPAAMTTVPTAQAPGLPALAATEVKALGPEPVRIERSVEAVRVGDSSVWRTPAGDGGVCLSHVGPDGATVNCVPRQAIEGDGAPPSTATVGCKAERHAADGGGSFEVDVDCASGEAILYGVASDSIERVTVEMADGTRRPATFANGVYFAVVPVAAAPVAVVLAGDRTDERLGVRLPGVRG